MDAGLPFARRIAAAREGTAAVEASIALPVFMLMLIGAADFGSVLYAHHIVQTGLDDAARYIARAPDPVAAEPIAKRLAVSGTTLAGRPQRLAYWSTTDVTVTYGTISNPPDPTTGRRAFRGGDQVRIVRVSTSVDVPVLTAGAVDGEAWRISMQRERRVVGQ